MPYYIVKEETGTDPIVRLVEAKNQAAALKTVIEPRFSVASANTAEAVDLLSRGIKVTREAK